MAELVLRDEDDLPGLQLELETTIAPVQSGCKCAGDCKTAKCPCKAMGYGCYSSGCKCIPAKCSIQMEEAAVYMKDIGGEMKSSDSEPGDFCHCRTVNSDCGDTLCYCLAIKQIPCVPSKCDCDPTTCKNVATSSQSPLSTPTDSHDTHSTGVKYFCSFCSKEELVFVLETVAARYPPIWDIISGKRSTPPQTQVPPWCKCGKCRSEDDPLDCICCNNHPKNHENVHFYHLCLDQQTLEIA